MTAHCKKIRLLIERATAPASNSSLIEHLGTIRLIVLEMPLICSRCIQDLTIILKPVAAPQQSNAALPPNVQPAKTPSSGDETASNLGSCAGKGGIIVTNSTFSGVGTVYSVTPETKLCTDKDSYDDINKALEIK